MKIEVRGKDAVIQVLRAKDIILPLSANHDGRCSTGHAVQFWSRNDPRPFERGQYTVCTDGN